MPEVHCATTRRSDLIVLGCFRRQFSAIRNLRSSQDFILRPQVPISGTGYDFTFARRRYNPIYFVGTVEPVIDLQAAFAVRRRESGVLCRASSASRKRTIAQVKYGDVLWHTRLVCRLHRGNGCCHLDPKPKRRWSYPTHDGFSSWATGTCTVLVLELRGTVEVSSMRRHVVPKLSDVDGVWKGGLPVAGGPRPLFGQALPIAPVGWVRVRRGKPLETEWITLRAAQMLNLR